MTKQTVLIIQPLMEKLDAVLSDIFECHRLYEYPSLDAYLAECGNQAPAIVTRGDVGVAREIMASLPELQVISVFGVGTDRIDRDYTAARQIKVSITSDILTDDVADLALTLLLGFSRNLIGYHQFAVDGQWEHAAPSLSSSVKGKKVGIVGLGKIGLAIASRAQAFGMEIGYHNRKATDSPHRYFSNLTELAIFADFLVLALPGSEENKHLVNYRVLQALGENGVLINVARGNVVDQEALASVLAERSIKGAALDVYAQEPIIPQALRSLPNVILTPHIASATHETRQRMADNVVANLQAYFASGKLLTPA